jgi:hypothetical protein
MEVKPVSRDARVPFLVFATGYSPSCLVVLVLQNEPAIGCKQVATLAATPPVPSQSAPEV